MVDSKYHEYNLEEIVDIPACSIEREVTVIPPANAQGYMITPNQAPVIVSYFKCVSPMPLLCFIFWGNFLQILKEAVDKTRLRWWERRWRGDSSYPPRILFTVSQTDPARARDVQQLQ